MFCFKCGKEIPEESAFCSHCGTKIGAAAADAAPAAETKYTLTLDRASQVYAVNPPIKAVIDNSIRMSVDNGKTEQVSLASGHHKVELSGSFRSSTVEFDMEKDTVLEISFSRLSGKIVTKVI